MTQIFFDISDIIFYIREHRQVSGIQRAAIKIIAQSVKIRNQNVFVSFYHPSRKLYLTCPASDLLAPLEDFNPKSLAYALKVPVKKQEIPKEFLVRYQEKPLKQILHIIRMHISGKLKKPKYFHKNGLNFDYWQKLFNTNQESKRVNLHKFEDVANPDDILCGLGAIWGRSKVTSAFQKARIGGLRIFLLIHDLIPINLPHLAHPQAERNYYAWLVESAKYVTAYLANSQATATDLKTFLEKNGLENSVHVTALAQDLVQPSHTTPPTLSDMVREATTLPYVLCVGTIEPRKNLWRLVQIWKRLSHRQDLDLPRLILAGRRGWLTDQFISMLARTGGLDGWVIWLDTPNDAELEHLYRNCLFTATVSLYEGWGLPIGEALSYGKTGVVSQTSSMPEVGGDMVIYCDPASIQSMETALLTCLDPKVRKRLEIQITQNTLRTWDDVGHDVMAVLEQ